jgi:aspartate/methionine/tyrosine aminotransferase
VGFHAYQTPYDWGKLAAAKDVAQHAPHGMIDLSVGSPVDGVSQSVQEALSASADNADAHGYPATQGTPALRTAIADWFLNCRNIDLQALHAGAVPTLGSKEAVSLMASFLHLGDGDVVVQPRISYPTYEIGSQLAGAEVLKVDDVADVESWRHVPGVKAIWVNSPNNPTGGVLPMARMASIVAAARDIGATVLSDECYALMSWDESRGTQTSSAILEHHADRENYPLEHHADRENYPGLKDSTTLDNHAFALAHDTSPAGEHDAVSALSANVCMGRADNILVLYSLSKQSNMAGYRTAFIAGDNTLIEPMTAYRKQIGQIIPGPIQSAMVAALRDVDTLHAQKTRYRNRLLELVEALRAYGYEAAMPQGALYVWVRSVSGDCWHDIDELAKLGIIASPGEFYGAREYLRFSVTASDDDITAACARLTTHGRSL